jgi:hypothetical protein
LDICRKRDYRFLSLEALSLTALPSALLDGLSSSSSSPPPPPEFQGPNAENDQRATHGDGADGDVVPAVDTQSGPDARALLQPVLDGVRLGSQLTALFLNDNSLAVFPAELARLSQLRELHMHYNQLTTLPPCIGDFPHLEKLFLSHNALVSLPPEIGRLTSLQTLSLFNNHLASLPPQLGQLRSLQSLFLNDNALTSLPPQLFDALAGSLTVLQLNANKLSALPVQIGRLARLKKLNLESNALVTVPASLALLPDLSVLAFRRNLFHYAVSGTWSVGPPTLLHLSCAAVRRHLHTLSPLSPSCSSFSSSSSSSSTSSSSSSPRFSSSSSSLPPPSSSPPSSPSLLSLVDALENGSELPTPDSLNGRSADHRDKADDHHEGHVNELDLVQGLNITEDLKKLLLDGESGCSVCGRPMYGDGHVVRVFPMELVPSLNGGVCLSLVSPTAAAASTGPAAAVNGHGGGGGGLFTNGLHPAAPAPAAAAAGNPLVLAPTPAAPILPTLFPASRYSGHLFYYFI